MRHFCGVVDASILLFVELHLRSLLSYLTDVVVCLRLMESSTHSSGSSVGAQGRHEGGAASDVLRQGSAALTHLRDGANCWTSTLGHLWTVLTSHTKAKGIPQRELYQRKAQAEPSKKNRETLITVVQSWSVVPRRELLQPAKFVALRIPEVMLRCGDPLSGWRHCNNCQSIKLLSEAI